MADTSFYLINSLSRSGGTYLNALFDGLPGVTAFPFELPLSASPYVDFIDNDSFSGLVNGEAWLQETKLDYHLEALAKRPYVRTFCRERCDGDPNLQFDLSAFRSELEQKFSGFSSVRDAYRETWKMIFRHFFVDGESQESIGTGPDYVNHFANNTTRDFSILQRNADPVCRLYILYILRDSLENIASLKFHWRYSGVDSSFVKAAFSRWEVSLYSILRNRILFPDRCNAIVYSHDTHRMHEQLCSLSWPIAKKLLSGELSPTILGHPMHGQSYKERRGAHVGSAYDYEAILGTEGYRYVKRNTKRVFDSLGIDTLDDINGYTEPSETFKSLVEVDSSTFDLLLQRYDDAIGFANAYNVNFFSNLMQIVRDRGVIRTLGALVKQGLRERR